MPPDIADDEVNHSVCRSVDGVLYDVVPVAADFDSFDRGVVGRSEMQSRDLRRCRWQQPTLQFLTDRSYRGGLGDEVPVSLPFGHLAPDDEQCATDSTDSEVIESLAAVNIGIRESGEGHALAGLQHRNVSADELVTEFGVQLSQCAVDHLRSTATGEVDGVGRGVADAKVDDC